jgi:hypothetical protein
MSERLMCPMYRSSRAPGMWCIVVMSTCTHDRPACPNQTQLHAAPLTRPPPGTITASCGCDAINTLGAGSRPLATPWSPAAAASAWHGVGLSCHCDKAPGASERGKRGAVHTVYRDHDP